jgi:nucleotidyltransferase/DNA polymerase involved in DNA repair
VMQQPFILASCRGSLEYLRSYGFRTFSDFWDESYDDLDDDYRITAIGRLLESLNGISDRELRELQKHLTPVIEHNFRWFYSREFEELLWNELRSMMHQW